MNSYEVTPGLEMDRMIIVLNFGPSLKETIAMSKVYLITLQTSAMLRRR
jgi:hypothetical protein